MITWSPEYIVIYSQDEGAVRACTVKLFNGGK